MSRFLVMLADLEPADLLDSQKRFFEGGTRVYGTLLVIGAVLLSVIIGTIWAVLYSKKSKRPKHRHHHRTEPLKIRTAEDAEAESAEDGQSRKRRKRMRRPHRPLNPTLSQTRGLPPVRDPNSAPPLP